MITLHRQPTRHSPEEEDDDGNLVPPTAPGMATPESPADVAPAAGRRSGAAQSGRRTRQRQNIVRRQAPASRSCWAPQQSWSPSSTAGSRRRRSLGRDHVAFPKLTAVGIDSLVMDRLLGLAKEPNVALPASEDGDPTSLVIARCFQSHLGLKKRLGLVACATPADGRETSEEDKSAPVCAAMAGAGVSSPSSPLHRGRLEVKAAAATSLGNLKGKMPQPGLASRVLFAPPALTRGAHSN
ncbi:unnamed protein product [Lampetra planeri]